MAKKAKEQEPTTTTSIRWVMSDPAFERGVRDVHAGRPFPADFDDWEDSNSQWNYERGRAWAKLVPTSIALKRNGRVTDEAVRWYLRFNRDIL
jgi:hypothetical protein